MSEQTETPATPATPTPAPQSAEPNAAPRGFWHGRGALIMPAILVVIAIFLGVGVSRMEVADDSELFGPKAFPMMTILLLLVVAVLLTVSIVRNPEEPLPEGEDVSSNWRSVGIVVGTLVIFIALLETAGWIIAAALLFTGVAVGLGSRRYGLLIAVGFTISSIVQLVFVGVLGLSLPPGVFGMF